MKHLKYGNQLIAQSLGSMVLLLLPGDNFRQPRNHLNRQNRSFIRLEVHSVDTFSGIGFYYFLSVRNFD